MDIEDLSQFTLHNHGDRREKELWPLLEEDFPLYEKLWQRLIVPMTFRVDPSVSSTSDERNRMRRKISSIHERVAMSHYSVFYFVARAARRRKFDEDAMENPEDLFFLLDSSGDNLKRFCISLNKFGQDWGSQIFERRIANFPRGYEPFEEIEAYRDALLHNAVLGRGLGVARVSLPKWHRRPPISPLERVTDSWSKAEQLTREDLIDTTDLFDRIFRELFKLLDELWSTALHALESPAAVRKITQLLHVLPVPSSTEVAGSTFNPFSASGAWSFPEK